MKLKYYIIIAIVVIVIAIVAINWAGNPTDATASAAAKNSLPPLAIDGGKVGSTNGSFVRGITDANLNSTFLLMEGVTGAEVKELQTLINKANPAANLIVDGKFGPATRKQLKALTGRSAITLEMAWAFFVKDYVTQVQQDKNNFSLFGIKF